MAQKRALCNPNGIFPHNRVSFNHCYRFLTVNYGGGESLNNDQHNEML